MTLIQIVNMNKPINDFDEDMPEMTDEIMNEFMAVKPIDVQLAPAEVKPVDQNAWINQYDPRPAGTEIYALDALIVFLSCALAWFIINAWMYVFS